MNLSEFILLGEEKKRSVLLNRAILIGKRSSDDRFVFLFQLESFYVEIYCNMSDQQVQEYKAFENTTELKPYLDNISIDDLLRSTS